MADARPLTEALIDFLLLWARQGAPQPKHLAVPRSAYLRLAIENRVSEPTAPMVAVGMGPHEIAAAQVPMDSFQIAGPQGYVEIRNYDAEQSTERQLKAAHEALYAETQEHASCLIIAKGAPLKNFTPTRLSHYAVIGLRDRCERAEAKLAELERNPLVTTHQPGSPLSEPFDLEKARRVTVEYFYKLHQGFAETAIARGAAPAAVKKLLEEYDRPRLERGAGIAPLPLRPVRDDSVAHLDVDLLADDAP